MNLNEMQAPGFRGFAHLTVLRSLRKDPVLQELIRAEKHPEHAHHLARARETLLEQAEALGLSGDLWQGYFFHLLAEGNSLAGKVVEEQGQAGSGIQAALVRDLEQVQPFFTLTAGQVFGDRFYENYEPARIRSFPAGRNPAAALPAVWAGRTGPVRSLLSGPEGTVPGHTGFSPLCLGRYPGV